MRMKEAENHKSLQDRPQNGKGINTKQRINRRDICHAIKRKKRNSNQSDRDCFPGHRQRDAKLLQANRSWRHVFIPALTLTDPGQRGISEMGTKTHQHSAASTPKAVKHQRYKENKAKCDRSRSGGQSLGVDFIKIDHAMGVITQSWRTMT